jgi:hypothetical protein
MERTFCQGLLLLFRTNLMQNIEDSHDLFMF